jgi:hypothetical protein
LIGRVKKFIIFEENPRTRVSGLPNSKAYRC